MPENYQHKGHPINDRISQANPSNLLPEQADYIDGAKYHGNINKTIIDFSKTNGMDGMRR